MQNNTQAVDEIIDTPTPPSHWRAYLSLHLTKTQRGVVLKNTAHQGPLYVQKAFYPEGNQLAHLYILHPPGGLVSGDTLRINVQADEAVKTLLTTPGAGRVYKARADKALQRQDVQLEVGKDACIEWLPLETILYPGANTRLNTRVRLSENAHFIGWDICTLGLPACKQTFDNGSFEQCLQIEIQDKIALRERLVLNDNNRFLLNDSAGFAGRSTNGLMVAGPFHSENSELMAQLQQYCLEIASTSQQLASVSLCNGFLLVRYLGHCSEQARILFTRCWSQIRPALINTPPCAPRIWAT